MANKSLVDETVNQAARRLFNVPRFELTTKLKHVTDVNVLKELKHMAEFQNRTEIIHAAQDRASDIGLSI